MTKPRILAFSGSSRTESYNQRLVKIAAQAAEDRGAEVTLICLGDYPIPLFDQDAEKDFGPPQNATRLKELFLRHDGLLIACPEYNSSITPLLKNTIDWVSRAGLGEPPLAAYRGKTAAILAASPGALGGLRGLVHVRAILGNIGVTVLPDQVAVPSAQNAFSPTGSLVDPDMQTRVRAIGERLADVIAKLQA
jgi:chromate reductase, NAD(P)H dehydrogenase (quinone)